MASVQANDLIEMKMTRRLGVTRMLAAGGLTAGAIFVLCWLGTFIPFAGATHDYIGLFTSADVSSPTALAEGLCWSLLFGALVGAAFALTYNATAALDRR